MTALTPSPTLLAKLGSIVVHAEEGLGKDGHQFDLAALTSVLNDPEVATWRQEMEKLALLPVTRKRR